MTSLSKVGRLTEAQRSSMQELLAKGTRSNRYVFEGLNEAMVIVALSHTRYAERLVVVGDTVRYNAGQDYPSELSHIRKLILQKWGR